MYIKNSHENKTEEHQKYQERLEAPDEELIEEYSEDTLSHWEAPEFEIRPQNKKRLLYAALILLAIIGYASFTNSPIMAIAFVLIGIVAYMNMQKAPRVLNFRIIPEGVLAGKELYAFENIKSFWIFYDPEYKKIISLNIKSYLTPFIHIPIHNEDPVEIRRVLLKYIPEIKQENNLAEILERFLGI